MLVKIEPKVEKKKTAIVSLGGRITLTANNVRSVDLTYLRLYLINILGRETVDYLSKKTKKEEGIEYYKNIKDVDLNDYDEVYIYNASFNVFGGRFNTEALITCEKLYSFNGDIIYFQIDPKLSNMDFGTYCKNRDKENTYTFNCDSKELNYAYKFPTEVLDNWREKVWKRIKIAFDGVDYPKFCKLWNDAHVRSKSSHVLLNDDTEWFEMPIAEYYAVNEEFELKCTNYQKQENPYELVYFGNNRQNERNKIIKQLYDINEFKKLFVGFDPEMDNVDVREYVKHDELFKLMGEQCLATLVIGDNLHNGNIKSARFFESMLVDLVAFIYIKYDPEKKYVKDEFLKDFIYVSTKEELKDKINKIKNDNSLYKKIIELERKEIIDTYGFMKIKSEA